MGPGAGAYHVSAVSDVRVTAAAHIHIGIIYLRYISSTYSIPFPQKKHL